MPPNLEHSSRVRLSVLERRSSERGSLRSIKLLIAFFALVAVLLIALHGWQDIYSRYLAKNPPVITFAEHQPRGIGISPVTISFQVSDPKTGLDEVVVRVRQKGSSKEILRRAFKGEHEARISVDIPGEKSNLEEGIMQLEIKAFDRSFWSNSAEKMIEMSVDYRKPRLEPVTAMHNTRRGGSQVVFYRAADQSLAIHGVKVGNQTFLGFPARALDKEIDDNSIFVAIYAVDMRTGDPEPPVRLFAQDTVGNATSAPFPNRILARPDRTLNLNLTEDFLVDNISDLADRYLSRIQVFAGEMGKKVDFTSTAGSPERLVEKFKLVNDYLRILNEQELVALLKRSGRFEALWGGAFLQQNGSVNATFGDSVNYKFNNEVIGTALQTGFDISMSKNAPDVVAAADGFVAFNENLGVFGRTVGIDHGLGLVSIYGRLDNSPAKVGDSVTAGQPIGTAGRTGFARSTQVYYELRLQGVPVDPREWWDKSWYFSHVTDQVNTAKRLLEIPVARPLSGGNF